MSILTMTTPCKKTFVYLHPVKEVIEVKEGEQEVDLMVTVDSYPEPNMTWYKDDEPIDLDDRHYEMRYRAERAKLKIYDVSLADAGVYELEAVNADMQSSESIMLAVTVPPTVTVTMDDTYPYYMVGDYVTLVCAGTGRPLPSVYWEWQQCDRPGCDLEADGWQNVEESRNIAIVVTESKGISQLVVLVKESGMFKCTVVNKRGEKSQHSKFVATDVADGFGFTEKYQRLFTVEGDTLSLTCKSSLVTHHVKPQMFRLHNNLDILLEDSDRLTITHSENVYSSIVEMTLRNIHRSDAVFTTITSNLTLHIQSTPPTGEGVPEERRLTGAQIGIISGIILAAVVLFVMLLYIVIRRVFMRRKYIGLDKYLLSSVRDVLINPDMPLDEQTDSIAYNPKWEFPRERLKFDIVLGQGEFGRVMKAEAIGINDTEGSSTVAVKMVRDVWHKTARNKLARKDWLKSFLARHPDLSVLPQGTNLSRAVGFNRPKRQRRCGNPTPTFQVRVNTPANKCDGISGMPLLTNRNAHLCNLPSPHTPLFGFSCSA
ncbi:Muscle M-line assembly protein unc-89 [Lamellibrachia satsuma]|nr:Muscle M-line assembly protein unc-89 [Lamellibrachia satsuma]